MIVVQFKRLEAGCWRYAVFRVGIDGQTHPIAGGVGGWGETRAGAMGTAGVLAMLDEAQVLDLPEDEPTLDSCTPVSGVRPLPTGRVVG